MSARDGQGKKYDRNLGIKEIAVRVRADIAAAIAAGELPEMKVSVRIERYSMGRSLHVNVTQLQQGFRLFNRRWILQEHALQNKLPHKHSPEAWRQHTGAGEGLLAALKRIVDAYNYDRSDIQSDHFDVNFYAHVGIHWEYERELRAAALAEALDPKFVQLDLGGDGVTVYCDCCVPSHLGLAVEPRAQELGGTCAICGATRPSFAARVGESYGKELEAEDARAAAPSNVASLEEARARRDNPHFEIYLEGPLSMSVCSNLSKEELVERANAERPTGISSRWSIADEPFQGGEPNGCPCNQQHAPGARHWLLHC